MKEMFLLIEGSQRETLANDDHDDMGIDHMDLL